jgi:hypothetical protein
MEGTRKRGRPRKNGGDDIEDDLSITEIRNRQAMARDRQERRKIVLEA